MSFALSIDGGRLEWASHSLDSIFVQRRNILSPSFLTMIREVLRFGKEAPKVCSLWFCGVSVSRCGASLRFMAA
jgi:predicted NAD/FAD-binding protein